MQARNAFCAVRPPGHHAGPTGVVPCENDRHGSHGFCLLSNLAIGAAYAMTQYRDQGAHLCCQLCLNPQCLLYAQPSLLGKNIYHAFIMV